MCYLLVNTLFLLMSPLIPHLSQLTLFLEFFEESLLLLSHHPQQLPSNF